MTIMDKIKKEGKIEGIKEGKIEGIKEGKIEGIKEGKIETARKMKQDGLDTKFISNYTGLTIEEINAL